MKLDHRPLAGQSITLHPLAEHHRADLCSAAQDPDIWRFMPIDGTGKGFDMWWNRVRDWQEQEKSLPYAVCLNQTGQPIGHTSFLNLDRSNHVLEIGNTWYRKDHWATRVNPEAKLLLLTEAFDHFGVERVEIRCDARNERSAAAIAKLGATLDGILRSHMIVQNGFRRDTKVFSIIKAEWPAVRARLSARLNNL